MSNRTFKVGDVLKNSVRQYTKIISIQSNRFGLSGWATRENAEKATVARIFLNIFGIEAAQVEIVKKGASVKDDSASSDTAGTDEKPTKSSLNKLNAKAVGELTASLGIEVGSTRAENLEKLYTHFEL